MTSNNRSARTIGSSGDDKADRNRLSLLRLGAMAATTLVLASFAPAGLAIATLSSLSLVSAVVIAAFALLYGERANAVHFTRWDEAAAMMALSLGSGMFVDPAAVEAALATPVQP